LKKGIFLVLTPTEGDSDEERAISVLINFISNFSNFCHFQFVGYSGFRLSSPFSVLQREERGGGHTSGRIFYPWPPTANPPEGRKKMHLMGSGMIDEKNKDCLG
jgi:hypothetical protein